VFAPNNCSAPINRNRLQRYIFLTLFEEVERAN
jgi:hypothetical protein